MNETAVTRVAVIGTGSMGRHHVRVYSELDNVNLVAVSDLDSQILEPLAERYHTRPYTDYGRMLEEEKPNIVSIAVPSRLHYQVAKEAVERGVHALIEKPLATSLEEGQRIIDLAAAKGVQLGVGHIERFNPVVAELKNRLNKNELGQVFQITIRRIGPFPLRNQEVGVFLDLATHDIDVMHYLTGANIQRLSAESANFLHNQHEDLAVGLLRFENGIIGVLMENWLTPTKVRDLIVNGERGMFVADFLTQDLYFYENNYSVSAWDSIQVFRGVAEGNMTRFHIARDEPLRLELKAFVDSVNGGPPFLVSGMDALRSMAVAQQLAQFAEQKSAGLEVKELD